MLYVCVLGFYLRFQKGLFTCLFEGLQKDCGENGDNYIERTLNAANNYMVLKNFLIGDIT